jgi:hypothetical protein
MDCLRGIGENESVLQPMTAPAWPVDGVAILL